ncbi:MAG: hypothetical protein U0325_04305 [Polyangiales bacterium]
MGRRRRATAQGVGGDDAAALAAICARDRQGDVRVALPLPAGVTEAPERAMPAGWRRAAALRFAVSVAERRGSRVVLRGVLENTATTPLDVYLSEAGTGYFHATLTGDGLRRRDVPAVPLPPRRERAARAPADGARVHARARRAWTHLVEVELGCWSLEGRASVNAHWWFSVDGEASQGDVTVACAGADGSRARQGAGAGGGGASRDG